MTACQYQSCIHFYTMVTGIILHCNRTWQPVTISPVYMHLQCCYSIILHCNRSWQPVTISPVCMHLQLSLATEHDSLSLSILYVCIYSCHWQQNMTACHYQSCMYASTVVTGNRTWQPVTINPVCMHLQLSLATEHDSLSLSILYVCIYSCHWQQNMTACQYQSCIYASTVVTGNKTWQPVSINPVYKQLQLSLATEYDNLSLLIPYMHLHIQQMGKTSTQHPARDSHHAMQQNDTLEPIQSILVCKPTLHNVHFLQVTQYTF